MAAAGRLIPLGLLFLICAVQAGTTWPFPQDDLLRNVASFAWGFDYRKLYAYSPGTPSFNPYIGFDWVLGTIAQTASLFAAVVAAQALSAGLLVAATVGALRKLPHFLFRATLIVLLVGGTLVTSRLVAGRPEIIATAWLLSAAILPRRVWLLLGCTLAPAYWLMPIYAVGALLGPGSWRSRVCWWVAAGIGASLFWWGYAGLEWLNTVRELPHWAALRQVDSGELAPVYTLLQRPGTALLALAALLTIAWRRSRVVEIQWLAVAAFFLVVGSARHVLVLAPVLAVWVALQMWRRVPEPATLLALSKVHEGPSLGHWCAVSLLAVISGIFAAQQMPGDSTLPKFELPPGSSVLAAFDKGVFALPYYNPGSITMAPSIESAWDTPVINKLAVSVKDGSLTCDQLQEKGPGKEKGPGRQPLQGLGQEQGESMGESKDGSKGLASSDTVAAFTHVLTRKKITLRGPCFNLGEEKGDWRLWTVVRSVR